MPRASQCYVLSFGSGSRGKLGLGDERNRENPETISQLLETHKIVQVACGGWTSMVLLASGEVLGCGSGRAGRLPIPPNTAEGDMHTTFVPLNTLGHKIKQIALGGQHGLFLTVSGRVMAFGDSAYGQTALHSTQPLTEPRFIEVFDFIFAHTPSFGSITGIFAGWKTSALITESGACFLWGANTHSQLTGAMMDRLQPVTVYLPDDKRAKKIALGQSHTLFLADDGTVYSCGLRANGRLGYHPARNTQKSPRKVEALEGNNIVDIAAGYYHSLALTELGSVYVFGSSNEGQCGTSSDHDVLVPTLLVIPLNISSISAGGFHSLLAGRAPNGEIETWFCGIEWSSTGGADDDDVMLSQHQITWQPRRLRGLPDGMPRDTTIQVTSGGTHSLILLGSSSQIDIVQENLSKIRSQGQLADSMLFYQNED